MAFRPCGFRGIRRGRQGKSQAGGRIPLIDACRRTRHEPRMLKELPPCPWLPEPRAGMDWRALHAFRNTNRGPEFYQACLEYAQALWRRRLPARALLCLDRALGAELKGDEPVLGLHPLPYSSVAWILQRTPAELFLGNPRVHFQHYADRMNEPWRDRRRWRAWACWAITRTVRPELAADPRHLVTEPTFAEIEVGLRLHGHQGEAEQWRSELSRLNPERSS